MDVLNLSKAAVNAVCIRVVMIAHDDWSRGSEIGLQIVIITEYVSLMELMRLAC